MGACTVTTHTSGGYSNLSGGAVYGGSVSVNTPTIRVGGNRVARQVYRRRVNNEWISNLIFY